MTANDDRGGGTYQLIEALRDRIDVIVQALSFSSRFLGKLLARIEEGICPEELVPREIIFTDDEIDRMGVEIRQVEVPQEVRRRIKFFASQFELAESAGGQFEYMTKDTARLKDLGCQTMNGLSVRNLMTLLTFAKALAYFRGNPAVELDDVRQILPFVLHDKLQPDPDSPFFGLPENAAYRTDRLSWLRCMLDLSNDEYNRLNLDNDDPVGDLSQAWLREFYPAAHILILNSCAEFLLPHNDAADNVHRQFVGWVRIPRQTGHPFHGKLDTWSSANWTLVPCQTGHLFHVKLDTLGVTARG